MGCPSEVKIGETLTFTVNTHNPATAQGMDADALPTYRVYENGADTPMATGNMAMRDAAGTLGFYAATLTCSAAAGYEDGKSYNIYIAAVVLGTEGTISYGFKVRGEVADTGSVGLPSEVAICNAALLALGDEPITAMTDASRRAQACQLLYAELRDELLAIIRPGFSVSRATLALLATAPVFGFAYAYQLPANCILPLEEGEYGDTWRREGQTIVSNQSGVTLRYVARITDPASFSRTFTMALVAYLSFRLAYALTKSSTVKREAKADWEAALAEAWVAEGQQGTAPVRECQTLIEVR